MVSIMKGGGGEEQGTGRDKKRNRHTDRQTDRQRDRGTNKQTERQTERQADEQINRQIDRQTKDHYNPCRYTSGQDIGRRQNCAVFMEEAH